MELIETEAEAQAGALPEPEPRYQTAFQPVQKTEHGQTWIRTAAAILLAIVLIVLVVLLARWIYHKAHNNSGPATPTTSQTNPAPAANNPTASPAPSSSSTPSGTTNTTRPSSSTPITNTGPGNVAAIFIGTAIAAAGLHYIVSLRRTVKQS